jgi:ribonuclease BN (tRNA processing enzyme)
MSFSITVLGSSATFATKERAASGYLVEIDGFKLWLDAGGGTWRNLLSICDYTQIDGILLSHRHPDHTIDIFQAFHAWAYGGKDVRSIPLWAPQEALEWIGRYSPDLPDYFDAQVIAEDETTAIGPAQGTFVRMAHPVETLGVRLENAGRILAYTADSGVDADFMRLASNADVFVCEATYQDDDDPWEGHMRAGDAGAIAAAAGVSKLLLVHLPHDVDLQESLDQAKAKAGDIDVMLATDLTKIEVSN